MPPSGTTRQQALTKLAGFGYKIGYPDEWRDFSSLALDRSSFVGNRLEASAFEMRRQIARLGGPMDEKEWAMPAHVVNAYYHPLRNEIVFPAGILQPPFFYADADDAVNYGGIGTVIGHEITHGFDDTGSRFDAAGALRDWWTAEDRTEFERRANVIVEQFDGYTIADDVNVNGRLTLGENIADLGGIAISYDAMHEAVGDDAPPDRRAHPGPAILPGLRLDVADGLHRRGSPDARERRHPLAVPVPGERPALEHAGVRGGVRDLGRRADGPRRRPAGEHLVADASRRGEGQGDDRTFSIVARDPETGEYVESVLALHEQRSNLLDPAILARIGSAVAAGLKSALTSVLSPEDAGATGRRERDAGHGAG